MRARLLVTALALAVLAPGIAAAVEVQVIVHTDVRPGVYGRVDLRGAPPPPLVYERPVLIAQLPRAQPRPEPVYLHVPPGHAKDWRKHCRKYDACNRPVYFVMSDEHKPKKPKKPRKDKHD